ncbi:MAG: SDR family oxidoreductase [Cytophagales bacterium]|nr:SDR family oxidoreductase [Cytophagales bacterium]
MEKSNQLVVVTGGTKGIGRAIIDSFAKEGYDIATCSRNEDDLQTTKAEVQKDHEISIHTLKADLGMKSEALAFISFVKGIEKEVCALVNNTGLFVPAPIHEEEEGLLETMINTNLYSAYHLCRGFIPEMKARHSGHIFNICSVASIKAYPTGGSYSISKFAMYGLTKGLREELKTHGVKVTAILPGATQTSSWEGEEVEEGQLMKPEDVAELVWTSFHLGSRSVVEDIVVRPQLGDI